MYPDIFLGKDFVLVVDFHVDNFWVEEILPGMSFPGEILHWGEFTGGSFTGGVFYVGVSFHGRVS